MGAELFKRIIKSPFWQPIQIAAAIITITLAINPPLVGIELSTTARFALFVISITIFSFLLYTHYFMPKIPIYPKRFDFMSNELPKFIKKANSIKISNIAFTYFLKFTEAKNLIKNKIEGGAKFEILFTKRKRKKDDISFYILREDDEDNRQLRMDMNKTLFKLFLFMLNELFPIQRDGNRLHLNLQIKEFPFVPVMCMYIFDDKDLIFGPYISKNCNDIPMFHLKKRIYRKSISGAYRELNDHYIILSNYVCREDKSYVEKFCYFDGERDISIHELIDKKHQKLRAYLNQERRRDYMNYLEGISNCFQDVIAKDLGEEELEGRFDAVMRDIVAKIDREK